MQTPTLRYEDLEHKRVDRLLEENGVVQISLTDKHASALSSLIEATQAIQVWRQMNRRKRVVPGAKTLVLAARIFLRHSKLFELLNLIVVRAIPCSSYKLSDGSVLFRFARVPGKV
jgi:hypothetical protein